MELGGLQASYTSVGEFGSTRWTIFRPWLVREAA
jgi:hypothetical protein